MPGDRRRLGATALPTDPKVRAQAIKSLEENVGKSFMTQDLAVISWIWHQMHRQSKKKK